jgi:hypothetical protein
MVVVVREAAAATSRRLLAFAVRPDQTAESRQHGCNISQVDEQLKTLWVHAFKVRNGVVPEHCTLHSAMMW